MIDLPWPPALNAYYRSVPGKGVLISAKGRAYRDRVSLLALSQRWPRMGSARISVLLVACAPDRRRRDLDGMLKALLDALTHAGIWDDDSQIDDLRIVRGSEIVEGGKMLAEIVAMGDKKVL